MSRVRLPLAPRWLRWVAVLLVAAAVLYFSVLTAPPAQPVVPYFDLIPLDKWRHFLGYGLFAATLWYASADWPYRTRIVFLFVVGVALAYGLGMEAIQSTLPERDFSLLDAYADLLGALLVTPLFYLERFVAWRPVAETNA